MTSTLTRPRLAIAALAGLAVAAAPLAALPAFAAGGDLENPVTLDTGHIDAFNLALNSDGSVRLNLKEDVTGSHVQRTPESVQLFVKDDAYLEGLPAEYLPPGAPTALWHLPMTQDSNLIWPGWDSQGVASVYGAQADVDIVISDVEGPGDVYLWSQGVFGDPAQLLVNDWALPDTIHQNYLAHVHANWGFTAPGTYQLTAQATVTSADGTLTSTSNAATYTFLVEPVGGIVEPEPQLTTLEISGLGAHYHTGDIVSLTAVQTPASDEDHYHWFTRPSAADEWTVVNGALSESYGFVATGEQQVKVVLYDHDHAVIAESAPADIVIDDHGNTPGVGPELNVSLAENEGALVISVAPEGATSTLGELLLAPAGDRYVSDGSITGITVTDTRPGELGWSATGRVRALGTITGDILDGKYLGWTPTVVSASDGQNVTPGAPVTPGFDTGNGIKGWSTLGSAPEGASRGTAVLGAGIRIEAPTTTQVGDYSGVVLITVI